MSALENIFSTAPLHIGGAKSDSGLALHQSGANWAAAATLIQKCASTGLKGWNKAMLLRLDKEELDAVKGETTTAEIRLAT